MPHKSKDAASSVPAEEHERLRFSEYVSIYTPQTSTSSHPSTSHLTSPIVTVAVSKSRTFYLHLAILTAESEKFSRELKSGFKEASKKEIDIADEDPDLFGFFVEYIYRDRSILSRDVAHYSDYVTLARLYALGERLIAPSFQAHCLWRFTKSLSSGTTVSDESTCELLQIACAEITERVKDDALRSHIFWYGATKIASLQKCGMFRQLLCDVPEVGRQLCLWVNLSRPSSIEQPSELQYKKFQPESEYGLTRLLGKTKSEEAEGKEE
jgi:hypothetical protein